MSYIGTAPFALGGVALIYGVGNGIADDTAAVQAALSAGYSVADGRGLRYKCTASVTLPAGVKLQNATLEFTNSGTCLQAAGSIAAGLVLTGNTAAGTAVVSVASTATLAADDYVFLASTALWASGVTYGQYAQIKSVDSSTQVTLYDNVLLAFNTADSATIAKVTPCDRPAVERVHFVGAGTGTQRAIYAEYCRGLMVERCTFANFDYVAVGMFRTIDSLIHGCSQEKATNAGTAYAYAVWGGCIGTRISDSAGRDNRHTVTVGDDDGINLHTNVSGCFAWESKDAGFDSHEASWFTTFSNCHVEMSGALFGSSNHDGIISQGAHTTIIGCTVIGAKGRCIAYEPRYNTSATPASCLISGNTMILADEGNGTTAGHGIDVSIHATLGTDIIRCIIADNDISGGENNANGTQGIRVILARANSTLSFLAINGNVTTDVNGSAVLLQAQTDTTIERWTFNGNNLDCQSASAALYVLADDSGAEINNGSGSGNALSSANKGIRVRATSGAIAGVRFGLNEYPGTANADWILVEGGVTGAHFADADAAPSLTVTNATLTVPDYTNHYIFDRATTQTLTLPSASAQLGRTLWLAKINVQDVVSGSSDVVPIAGGSASTAILSGAAGKTAALRSNGTNWQIIDAN